ncbi:MAG: flagellar basal body-associated FliL family protein [Thermoguttaceae bacterium]|nr:flagellar basal body-associated FliL family protein [Thermoguttaceae bacterium]MDW8039442.1 flagellar basal body-associated FliL family protein [Thermoguttaceae bacterium]
MGTERSSPQEALRHSTQSNGEQEAGPRASATTPAGRNASAPKQWASFAHWKGMWTLVLLLQPLIVSIVVGGYLKQHRWGDWIRRLARWGLGASRTTGGLGALAPREPTLVYYRPGEVSLGEFSIAIYDPVTRITLRADFRLDARAKCDNRQAFDAFVLMHHRLVRDQVMTAVRNASLEELTDPEHRLLRRRILTQVNRMLGQQFLQAVEIKNFSLWESVDQMSFLPYQCSQADSPALCP